MVHKEQCKVLKIINQIEMEETASTRTWQLYQEGLNHKIMYLRVGTSPSLQDVPKDIIQAQPYCVHCHRSAINIGVRKSLTPCKECLFVSTCDTCPTGTSHTFEQCKMYQQVRDVELYRIEYFEQTGSAIATAPTASPRQSYIPLRTVPNWYEYFTTVSDKIRARDIVNGDLGLNSDILQASLSKDELQKAMSAWPFLTLATEVLTMPLTILAALESGLPRLVENGRLTLHIIGANGRELGAMIDFEELLHLLPSLKELHIVCVGPKSWRETEDQAGQEATPLMPIECCPECTSMGRKRTMRSYRGLYHDYVQTNEYKKPSMAVLFHSGRSQEEEGSWVPTTRFLVASNILTLCTTYTKREADEEVAELDSLKARMVIRPQENKWRSLVPIPDYLEGPEHTMFYLNYYAYLFQGDDQS